MIPRREVAAARTELVAVQEQYVQLCRERELEREDGAVAEDVVEAAIEEVKKEYTSA